MDLAAERIGTADGIALALPLRRGNLRPKQVVFKLRARRSAVVQHFARGGNNGYAAILRRIYAKGRGVADIVCTGQDQIRVGPQIPLDLPVVAVQKGECQQHGDKQR